MSTELAVIDHYERVNQIVSLIIQGENFTDIARQLGIQRKDVMAAHDEWKTWARSNRFVQERAQDAIAGADQHYSMIILNLWRTVTDADLVGDLRLRKDTLLAVASVEDKRVAMLQKSGMLDSRAAAKQLEEYEKKQKLITEMMREIAIEYPELRATILSKLSAITEEPQAIES